MRDGFIKAAAAAPHVSVADVDANVTELKRLMKEAFVKGARIVVFPELSITGYSCGDLFGQKLLLERSLDALMRLATESYLYDAIFFAGLPFVFDGKLYDCAAAISDGKVLGIVPKTSLPDYHEFYEVRQFTPAPHAPAVPVKLPDGSECLFGTDIIFECDAMPSLTIAAEICEDLWAPVPPSSYHALSGADVIVNLSASNQIIGKKEYRRSLVTGQSARSICAYIYACAGPSESTTDLVFSGHSMIAENGKLLSEAELFSEDIIYADIDTERLLNDRRRMNTFVPPQGRRSARVMFHLIADETVLERPVDKHPFVPGDKAALNERCEEILDIQTLGLVKRLQHAKCETAVIGISGGLDSTLALLVAVRAFDRMKKDRSKITAVTMPGFGTTGRTHDNAVSLIKRLGCTFREVKIAPAVNRHFKDIGLPADDHGTTYENSQARERTQILMDIANMENGLVVGTGDLSELALGWATYNGDHMSMYGVNASVPKTLVRHLVRYFEEQLTEDKRLKKTLSDVLDTPVSPELLPPDQSGEIAQKTEDIVGPYELHDFFLYYMVRFGFSPGKILRLAEAAFEGDFGRDEILKWEKIFYRRFFTQQFKRSCVPDGPKVGSVALSPRGDWRMPSDASFALWLSDLEEL